MTPTQRRELERLIDAKVSAAIGFGVTGRDPAKALLSQAGTDLMHYLDEVTDYSAAEAVSVSGDELAQQIRRRNAAEALAYWDGFDAALTAVEEGQPLYGTTKKAVAALRVAARIGRDVTEHDQATSAEAVSGS